MWRWQRQEVIALINHLICHDVEERLIHEKEPFPNFRKDYDKSFAEISDLILTNPYEGITEEQANRAISMLNE